MNGSGVVESRDAWECEADRIQWERYEGGVKPKGEGEILMDGLSKKPVKFCGVRARDRLEEKIRSNPRYQASIVNRCVEEQGGGDECKG